MAEHPLYIIHEHSRLFHRESVVGQFEFDKGDAACYAATMAKRSRKTPKDINALAAYVVERATEEFEDSPSKDPAAVALGRKGGLKGGKVRASRMTPEERSESARHAAQARWRKTAP